jgi:hypothetical protein
VDEFENNHVNSLVNQLFGCNFNSLGGSCAIRNTGAQWERRTGKNIYYEIDLSSKDKTELFFENMIPPPDNGIACLDFRYKKYSTAGEKAPLQVLAWPFRGRPGKINIFRDSPDRSTWIRAQVTYRNIDNFFLIMFRGAGSTRYDNLHLAVDDITVTTGKCEVV